MKALTWSSSLFLVLSAVVLGCAGNSVLEKQVETAPKSNQQDMLERAIAENDEAIRLNERDSIAYYNRGVAFLGLGQFQRAIQDIDEARRLGLLRNLAVTLLGYATRKWERGKNDGTHN